MKTCWLSLVLAGLVLAAPMAAQAPRLPLPAPAAAKKALFWKVSSGENVGYLLGSIHLGSKNMYPLAKEVEDAFERSTALIVEVDINRVDQQGMQAMIFPRDLHGGRLLWNHVARRPQRWRNSAKSTVFQRLPWRNSSPGWRQSR